MALRRLLTVLLIVACANVAVFLLQAFVYTPLRVPTNSMWPSLQRGDRIAVNHTIRFADLRRGDLVVFAVDAAQHPVKPVRGRDQRLVVKRVIGLPGETVEAKAGYVAINSTQRLPESYLLGRRGSTDFAFQRIEPRHLWVLGDNRDHSVDSRRFGQVPAAAVVGRVSFRYWPVRRWHLY